MSFVVTSCHSLTMQDWPKLAAINIVDMHCSVGKRSDDEFAQLLTNVPRLTRLQLYFQRIRLEKWTPSNAIDAQLLHVTKLPLLQRLVVYHRWPGKWSTIDTLLTQCSSLRWLWLPKLDKNTWPSIRRSIRARWRTLGFVVEKRTSGVCLTRVPS